MATFEELQRLISIQDTKANLLSLVGTKTELVIVRATDTHELGVNDGSSWTWYGTLADLFDAVISNPSVGDVLLFDGLHWKNGSTSSGGHIHGIARWNAAAGATTFDLPDIAEYVESVRVAGAVQDDATAYSLSTDRTQVILAAGLGGDSIVACDYVIASI